MVSLKPQMETTPIAAIRLLAVPQTFPLTLQTAIVAKMKQRKSPGPDVIRTDVFTLEPALFEDAALELWRAVGRTGSAPPLLHSGLLTSIYK